MAEIKKLIIEKVFQYYYLTINFFKIVRDYTQRKYIFNWMISLQKGYLFNKEIPWITFDAINFLQKLDIKGMKIFEYGSGSSTLFWLSKGAYVVSIEHEPDWYKLISGILKDKELIDYRLVIPEITDDIAKENDFSNPDKYRSSIHMYKNHKFEKYVKQIDNFEDNSFDIIMIDGRARPSCIKHSYKKVKPGGIIILDNADREYYLKNSNYFLNDYSHMEFYGVIPTANCFSKTNVFIRNQ